VRNGDNLAMQAIGHFRRGGGLRLNVMPSLNHEEGETTMKSSRTTRSKEVTRRDLLKDSGLALGGLAIAGSAGPALAAPPGAPSAIPKVSLEKYPDPGQMRITFCGTWFTPRINQACNSIFVEVGNENNDSFVFDCGAGVVSRYMTLGVPWSRMDKIFLTHLHGDHMNDLVTIYCFGPSGDRKSPLHVYGPSGDTKNDGTWFFCKSLEAMCKWHRESFSFLQTGYLDDGDGYDLIPHELRYMQNPGVAYDSNGVKISHFPAIHARDGAISYKLEWNGYSMVFTGDTKPNNYVLQNARGVDVLIHEMTTIPEIWTTKMSGLKPPFSNEDDARLYAELLKMNTEVIENSHTEWGALGYIFSQTNPRLGVATHYPNDADLIAPGLAGINCSYPLDQHDVVIAQDLLVITIDADGTIHKAQADVCASCADSPWPENAGLKGPLAPPRYDGPLAQFNDKLIANIIPHDEYAACNYPAG
jgi:ribonuclease Z